MGKGGKEMLDNVTPAEAGATDLPLIPKSGLGSSRKTLIIFASPIYFGTMPGSMLSVMSRMQPWHVATFFLKKPLVQPSEDIAALDGVSKLASWLNSPDDGSLKKKSDWEF